MITDREIVKQLNQLTRQSSFYERFNQEKYRNPKGYVEQESVTFQLARQFLSFQAHNAPFFLEDFPNKQALIVLNQAYNCGFKSCWLDEKLLAAFCYSKLPPNLVEFKRVIPVGLLLLPPRIKNPDGQLIKWLMFHHRLASEPTLPIRLPQAKIEVLTEKVDSLTWFTILDDWTLYGVNQPLRIKENQLNYQVDVFHINELLQEKGKNIETATEKEFTDKITEILLQTLLYLQLNERELEAVLNPTRSPAKSAAKPQKLTPTIIGSSYQVKTQTSGEKVATGNRKSPMTHWRRGFYRWQPYGSRQQAKYKLTWIEPVLVKG